jgi:chromosome segregation ATPase
MSSSSRSDVAIDGVGLPPPPKRLLGAGAAAGPATASHLVGVADSLRRELHGKDSEIRTLRVALDERQRRLDDALAQSRGAGPAHAKLQADNDRLQREVVVLRTEKHTVEVQLAEASAFARKLESKLTGGGKEYLLEQNIKLRHVAKALREELDIVRATATAERTELDRALREVDTLASALELRVVELGGDVKSGLLYELAGRRDEVRRLTSQLAEAESGLSSADFELRELRIVCDRMAQEAIDNKASEAALSSQLEKSNQQRLECEKVFEEVTRERDVSLDFVSEQSSRMEKAVLRAESADRAVAALQQRHREMDDDLRVS